MAIILRNNFSLTTLLTIGACAQSLITLILPFRYAFLPAFTFLIGQVLSTAAASLGYIKNPYMNNVRVGKHTAQIPNADGTISQQASDKNVVVFLIGATCHGARGLFEPSFKELGDSFRGMWKEIQGNPAKWGYLGTGHDSLDMDGQNGQNGIKTLHVSYWKSIEHLHAYAQSPLHREGWAWWDEYRKHHTELGIFHETYLSPAGHWETIYENCQPLGLGNIQYPIDKSSGGVEPATGTTVSSLVGIRDVKYKGMANRLGRKSGMLSPA